MAIVVRAACSEVLARLQLASAGGGLRSRCLGETMSGVSVRVRLCGALRVEIAGCDISDRLPARQGRLLFAYLVLAGGRAVRRDELAEALWPDRAPRDPASALASVLTRLRNVLGAERLPARTTIRLDLGPDSWVDVDAVAAAPHEAQRALDAGDPERALEVVVAALTVIEEPLLADFERDWIEARRRELFDLEVPLVEAAVEAGMRIGGGALGQVNRLARRAVERHPLGESVHAAYMRASAARGDSAEALEAYDRVRVRLREELGATPSPALLELHQRLLTAQSVAPPTRREVRAQRIPIPPSPTFGRDEDLALLREWFEGERVQLATVVGPGGVGKTRLAVELAQAIGVRFDDGAAFVSLAALEDPGDFAPTVARALEVVPLAGEAAGDAVVRELREQNRLLVLDNFEHLLVAAAFVGELVASASRLRVLVTSREPLRLRAERVFRLHPFAVRDESSPAVALFESRAAAHDSGFRLGPDNAGSVLDICRRLDGLPLAIELAAGSLGVQSALQLAERLSEHLDDALRPGPRDAPSRQRSLTAMLEWSYALLGGEERRALAALAAFAGGSTVEAATAVTRAPSAVLESLVDKNLLVFERATGRLGMLETVRAFGTPRLDRDARQRHCEYYLGLAEDARPRIEQTGSIPDLGMLEAELANFRSALAWTLDAPDPSLALQLATALALSLGRWRLQREAERWLCLALALETGDVAPEVRAAALEAYATVAVEIREHHAATDAHNVLTAARESVALRRALGEPSGTAKSLCAFARVRAWSHCDDAYGLAAEAERLAAAAGDLATQTTARMIMALYAPTLDESLQLGDMVAAEYRATGNRLELAKLRSILCKAALADGEHHIAARLADDALVVAESTQEPGVLVYVLGDVGYAALFNGELDRAGRSFARQLQLADRHGELRLVNEALIGLAGVAAGQRQDELAAQLHGAADAATSERMRRGILRELDARCFTLARARMGEQGMVHGLRFRCLGGTRRPRRSKHDAAVTERVPGPRKGAASRAGGVPRGVTERCRRTAIGTASGA